jgi:hypothetical protein
MAMKINLAARRASLTVGSRGHRQRSRALRVRLDAVGPWLLLMA